MKLKFPKSYAMPNFDRAAVTARTIKAPTWLHIGAGNIFRIMLGGMQQDLLENNLTDTGIIAYECFDEEIIPKSFEPYDNFTLAVTLHGNGTANKRIIGSIVDAFSNHLPALCEVIAKPTLQMISFTVTELGYYADPEKVSPFATPVTTMEQITAGLYHRYTANAKPIALVSMDNLSENGSHIERGITTVAEAWHKNGNVTAEFVDYVKSLSYPWTMIDKITPRPSQEIAKLLEADGYKYTAITKTTKNTFIASFVNAESAQYLVIEDDFPNGRPPLEEAGAYLTDRETVRKTEQMKVCSCLNPLHTVLGVAGMLLNHPTIAACMKDDALVKLVNLVAEESLPTVTNPGIIDPRAFLQEVLIERFPNPYIPDTPARIACDNSQKVPVRFGVTLRERVAQGLSMDVLEGIPTFIALWLRYCMGKDDAGAKMELSPDPRLPGSFAVLEGLEFGGKVDLGGILSDVDVFGVDLYEVGMAAKVEGLFYELSSGVGAVRRLLQGI